MVALTQREAEARVDDVSCEGLTWVNIERPTQKEMRFLAAKILLSPTHLGGLPFKGSALQDR